MPTPSGPSSQEPKPPSCRPWGKEPNGWVSDFGPIHSFPLPPRPDLEVLGPPHPELLWDPGVQTVLSLHSPHHCPPWGQLGPAFQSAKFLRLRSSSNSQVLFTFLAHFCLLSCPVCCGIILFSSIYHHLFRHIREETEINVFITSHLVGSSLSFHFHPSYITLS